MAAAPLSEATRRLFAACAGNDPGAARVALDRGASIRGVVAGETSFYAACKRSNLDVVWLLLNYGPRFVEELKSRSPVFWYVWRSGFVDQSEFAVKFTPKGSDGRERDGETALVVACARGWKGVVAKLLAETDQLDKATTKGRTALWVAAKTPRDGGFVAVRQLVEAGARVDAVDSEGVSALSIAVRMRNIQVATYLLQEAGANPAGGGGGPGFDDDGGGGVLRRRPSRSPALSAVASGSVELLKLILSKKPAASLIFQERNCSPTYVAVLHRRLEMTKHLIAHESADCGLDAPNDFGQTPLWLAAQLGRTDFVALLLRHGADPNAPNKYGLGPLGIAAFSDKRDSVLALLDAGALVDRATPLRNVSDTQFSDIERACRKQHGGFTALYFAAQNGSIAVCRALLERGADVHSKSDCGTALDTAKRHGHNHVVDLLVAHGAQDNNDIPRSETSTTKSPTGTLMMMKESIPSSSSSSSAPPPPEKEHSDDAKVDDDDDTGGAASFRLPDSSGCCCII